MRWWLRWHGTRKSNLPTLVSHRFELRAAFKIESIVSLQGSISSIPSTTDSGPRGYRTQTFLNQNQMNGSRRTLIILMFAAALGAAQAAELLAPLLGAGDGLESWKAERERLIARWEEALGGPSEDTTQSDAVMEDRFETADFEALVYRQRTGSDTWQKVLLMLPLGCQGRRPGVVVPFYDPDRMCGYDLRTRERLGAERNSALFGLHLVKQGYVVAACEAYPFNLVPESKQPANRRDFTIWRMAAAELANRHPHWTGMGKLVHDTRRALDLLSTCENVDASRLALMGHSLGGKMAFYAGALDARVRATVASDFGIAWDSTNWGDPWYFGARLQGMRNRGLQHHQLLACAAPGSFFLIAGQYDNAESLPYLEEARKVHVLYGSHEAVEMFDHHSGHQPSWDALKAAYGWLARKLAAPEPDLRFLDTLASEQAKAGK